MKDKEVEYNELIEKHWNLIKDKEWDGLTVYHKRISKEEHYDHWNGSSGYTDIKMKHIKGVIHGLENGYFFHPV